jgi:hypothetical protein
VRRRRARRAVLRYVSRWCVSSDAPSVKGNIVSNTISRRAFVAGLSMLSVPVIVLGQEKANDKNKSKDADKNKDEKKKEAEEKKEEAKEKVEDREEVVDAPGTDHAQDRRKDRRKEAVKKPPGA